MIYTLTLNPALDYVVSLDSLTPGGLNRLRQTQIVWGGKGINVSTMLHRLGVKSIALGFAAGFTGQALIQGLEADGLQCRFIVLPEGLTRINVKIKGGDITEVNVQGPEISDADVAKLFEKLCSLQDGDTLVLAGSTPKGYDDIYENIMQKLKAKNVRFVVDTSGKKLLGCLKYTPFLIKPNTDELSEIAGKMLETEQDIIEAAKSLQSLGAVNVIVSMGKDGAILVDETGEVYRANPIKIIPVSTVGAGDSMVAGFLAGIPEGYEYALNLGNVCGAASAGTEILADREMIDKLLYF